MAKTEQCHSKYEQYHAMLSVSNALIPVINAICWSTAPQKMLQWRAKMLLAGARWFSISQLV